MRVTTIWYIALALSLAGSVGLFSFQQRSLAGRGAPQREHCATLVAQGFTAPIQRMEAKNTVIHQLIEGRHTLLEAAAWFRYINEATGAPEPIAVPGEESQSVEERYCRQVIRWTAAALEPESHARAVTMKQRLEAELAATLQRDVQ